MPITVLGTPLQGLMYRRQPNSLVDVALGLAPQTRTAPDITKFIQKMRECMKWARKKAEAFQVKEAEHHKCSRALALEVGDMVLVCVTAFKGHHKNQDRWENRENVVEKQPYSDVPVYMVCPRDRDWCSQTLHRNYLLPINSNIGLDKEAHVAGVENNNTSTPVPPVGSASADAGPSGMVTQSTAGSTPQDSLDQPAPLRCSVQETWN